MERGRGFRCPNPEGERVQMPASRGGGGSDARILRGRGRGSDARILSERGRGFRCPNPEGEGVQMLGS